MITKTIVTRFAPSPTGLFHAGGYRTALFAYIFARQNKGKFILRIEDTDRERSKKEYEENIIDSLKWLGLEYDEFYRQSERTDIYKKYLQKLIDTGQAYISKETPGEASGREEVIRFKNPNKKVVFDDLIRGRVEFDTTELKDFVIAKSLEEPIFHLVNVIDDHEMGMTHIIRGEDHISNTPRQILIYEAIGATAPLFAHIPLLLSTDRSKLSKRHGALPISSYREKGYLPPAIINYMALLGWHPSDDREILSLSKIIEEFSLDRVQKSGAIFDEEKLKWFNRQYMTKLTEPEFTKYAKAFMPEWLATDDSSSRRLLPLLRDKLASFGDIDRLFDTSDGGVAGELAFIRNPGKLHADKLLWKKNPDKNSARTHLEECKKVLENIDQTIFDSNNSDQIRSAIWPYAESHGKGDVLWPLRMAVTGQEKSPDPFVCIYILGRDESLRRITSAIQMLDQ